MSDTAAAFLTLPFLILVTLALEGTRIGCVWLYRNCRPGAAPRSEPQPLRAAARDEPGVIATPRR